MQAVNSILAMRARERFVHRQLRVGALDGPADHLMGYRDRDLGVARTRQPLPCARGNPRIAFASRHDIVPLVRFALLAGTGILSIDLSAGKSFPVPEMMLGQQWRDYHSVEVEADDFGENKRRLTCPPEWTRLDARCLDFANCVAKDPAGRSCLFNPRVGQR